MAPSSDPGDAVVLADLLATSTWSQTTIWPRPPPLPQTHKRATKDLRYVAMIERMTKQHPNYTFLRNELLRAKGTTDAERGRAAVLEFYDDSRVKTKDFKSSVDLESYLLDPCSGCHGRLYLLEDIATNYVEVFGHHFCINPSFFARQLRTTSWEASDEASSPTPLQSTSDHDAIFSLCYPELVKFLGSEVRMNPGLFCHSNVYRYVSVLRQKDFIDDIGLIHRRFSFWSRRNANGIWDALLLVDPPIGDILYSSYYKNKPIDISIHDYYQGGYVDFAPWISRPTAEDIEMANQGPPRTSLFDDIIYYWTQKPYRTNSATPSDAAFYAKGIAVANWMNALEYVQKCICVLEYSIELNCEARPQRSLLDGLGWLEDNMSIIYSWKRTCSEYSDRMDSNLMELNIPLLAIECLGGDEHKEAQDWLYIHKRLQMWMSRSQDLVQSALGLLSRVEAERSLGEARNTRLLAILGTIFLPLSLVSSIFSMGGDFLPGQPRFWVYFSISLPLLCIALAVVFAPRRIIEIVVLLTPRW